MSTRILAALLGGIGISAIQGRRYQISNNKGHVNGWVGRKAIYGKCTRIED